MNEDLENKFADYNLTPFENELLIEHEVEDELLIEHDVEIDCDELESKINNYILDANNNFSKFRDEK
jgi:hypothetical protein